MTANLTPMATYRAHTNIALIKYWGKRHDDLILPMTSSLSLTLDAFYTDTAVTLRGAGEPDRFFLNGQEQSPNEVQKISAFVDRFRHTAGSHRAVTIASNNHVPTAAGLASSASAFCALGLALNDVYGLNFPYKTLSTYIRQGSGSACRSLYGGFVLWHRGNGHDSASSYSEPLDQSDWDIRMLVVALNQDRKKISSRNGMEATLATSPYYRLWPQEVEQDLQAMIAAIAARDFNQVGALAEHNAMKMHATTLAARPPFTYFQPDSLVAIALVHQLREEGIPCYYTMDAGPNVKILCQSPHVPVIQQRLLTHFQSDQLILAKPGPGPVKLR